MNIDKIIVFSLFRNDFNRILDYKYQIVDRNLDVTQPSASNLMKYIKDKEFPTNVLIVTKFITLE